MVMFLTEALTGGFWGRTPNLCSASLIMTVHSVKSPQILLSEKVLMLAVPTSPSLLP